MSSVFLNIESPYRGRWALSHTGFRPFFIIAALFSALSILLWGAMLHHGAQFLNVAYRDLGAMQWHAHEMLFGFAMAVIAGFLLTAVKNWTQQTTLTGISLLLLAGLWIMARVSPLIPFNSLAQAAWLSLLLNGSFITILCWVISRPVFRAKQWQHMAVIGKVWFFLPACVAFHLGLLKIWPLGVSVGIFTTLFVVLALLLTLARRVMPMFIERGLNNGFVPRNLAAIDRFSLVLFLLFSILEVVYRAHPDHDLHLALAILAAVQFIVHNYRLSLWHHRDIWKHPLIWSLFVAYLCFNLGFLLEALTILKLATHALAIHAFTVGGLGLFTLGMMARISLGHTGRSVYQPPRTLGMVFVFCLIAFALRVIGIWLIPAAYNTLLVAAYWAWAVAFFWFCVLYIPMLLKARADGLRG